MSERLFSKRLQATVFAVDPSPAVTVDGVTYTAPDILKAMISTGISCGLADEVLGVDASMVAAWLCGECAVTEVPMEALVKTMYAVKLHGLDHLRGSDRKALLTLCVNQYKGGNR
jgi:hypothetical protein